MPGQFAPGFTSMDGMLLPASLVETGKDTATPREAVQKTPRPEAAKPKATAKPPYPPAAKRPTQQAPQGICFDFNLGARIMLPKREQGAWRVRLSDLDTGNVLFQTDSAGGYVASTKKWFVRFRLEVWDLQTDPEAREPVLSHEYDARGREVLVQFPIGTLGDILAWFPYAPRFAQEHGCRLTCSLSGLIIPLLRDAYPDIRLVTHEEFENEGLAEQFYATYSMGLFFDDAKREYQPTDFRQVGLHRTAGYILGVDPSEAAPRIVLPDESRPIAERYVCIAVQATTQAKMWNNPNGWHEVIAWLKQRGYRVICIDQKPVSGHGLVWNHIPHGAEDETGNRPLTERARWLRHADAFIGLSSGLSWLAWAAGCPTVMVSGFTHPTNEFTTPGRVVNWHACNSCWNDPGVRFDHKDFLWCPRHKDTPRQFECTRLITTRHVTAALERVLPS